MKTGILLKKFFDEKGLKQKELAELLEVSEPTISRAISGIIILRKKHIEKLIDYLKLSKDEKLEVWKAWTLDRGEKSAVAYFEKLDKENKKLKKILTSIRDLKEV